MNKIFLYYKGDLLKVGQFKNDPQKNVIIKSWQNTYRIKFNECEIKVELEVVAAVVEPFTAAKPIYNPAGDKSNYMGKSKFKKGYLLKSIQKRNTNGKRNNFGFQD